MTQAVRDGSQAVLRPLSVLVPLIKDNLEISRERYEKALSVLDLQERAVTAHLQEQAAAQ